MNETQRSNQKNDPNLPLLLETINEKSRTVALQT